MEITASPQTQPRQITVCPKCGHEWFCRIIPMKIYYMCPRCHYQFKIIITE